MDRIAIDEHAVPGYTLMQRAASAAFADASECFPESTRWQIVCGAGNNAGDGYVMACIAHSVGIEVSVVSLVDPEALEGDARTAFDDYVDAGGEVKNWAGELDPNADLLVDALLGNGIDRAVTGEFEAVIDAMNAHWAPLHALDIPSGIHGDSGAILGAAVVADLTTTFVGLKSGLFLGDAPDLCGEVRIDDLDIAPEWVADIVPEYRVVTREILETQLAPRPLAAHKGDFGNVLVVGGGPGMPGAALLCGAAALRSGAGRVFVATHPEHAGALAAARPELMVHAVADASDLERLLVSVDVIAVGPGLGRCRWAADIFDTVSSTSLPAVWDADALNWLADAPSTSANRIITPHPGEAGRLLQRSSAEIQQDRRAAVTELQATYGGVAAACMQAACRAFSCLSPFCTPRAGRSVTYLAGICFLMLRIPFSVCPCICVFLA